MNIELRDVTLDDADFLYDALKFRPAGHNINHRLMPTMEQHCDFIAAHPYKYWAIIILNTCRAGNIYLGHDFEVGVDISQGYRGMGLAWTAIEMVMQMYPNKQYIANIAPENDKSQKFFRKHGFKLIQHTYRLDVP